MFMIPYTFSTSVSNLSHRTTTCYIMTKHNTIRDTDSTLKVEEITKIRGNNLEN